nr:hypothetical protein [Candidatus Sigynarchaeota archaeon]
MKDFAGMTATFEFRSLLIAFFGYNRTGKTNPIKAMKWLFKGIKQTMDRNRTLTSIMGDSKETTLEMVYEFKGILYRLQRRLVASKDKEYFSLTSSKMTGENYLNTRDGIRDQVAFSNEKREDIIEETEVKLVGINANTNLLDEKLQAVGLYPQMIDRLIAIENVQEFKNATKQFAGKDGGYNIVKELLSKELKQMQTALEGINSNGRDLVGKLQIFDQNIEDEYAAFMHELLALLDDENVKDADDVRTIINTLVLTQDPEKRLGSFRLLLSTRELEMDRQLESVRNMLGLVQDKRDKYEEYNKHEDNLDLELIDKASASFKTISDSFKSSRENLGRCISTIEASPPSDAFVAPEFKTDNLTVKGLEEALQRNELSPIASAEEIQKYQDQLVGIMSSFNQARNEFIRIKELKDKHVVSNLEEVITKKGSYQELQERLEHPEKIEPSTLFPLSGRVEKNQIQVYMPVDKFIQHIDTKPFVVNEMLLPYSADGKKGIPEDILKGIIDSLQVKIDELDELEKKMSMTDSLMEGLQKDLKTLDTINSQFDSDLKTIEDWNQAVVGAQTLAITFVEKHLKKKTKGKTFTAIKSGLADVKTKFIDELKAEMGRSFADDEDLVTNLDKHDQGLLDLKAVLDITIKVLGDIGTSVTTKQEDYKKWCRDLEVARVLYGKFLPTLIAVNEQVLSNINIDKIEEELVQSIIKLSQAFYQEITGERYLVIEREGEPGSDIYLKTTLRRPSGDNIDLLDDAASGSEQASIALGIMVALAKMFSAFVVIDETTDRFDYPTKIRFFKAIEKYSKEIFTIIVLKVDANSKYLKEDFEIMRSTFPDAVIYQPKKVTNGAMTATKVERFEDLTLLDDTP